MVSQRRSVELSYSDEVNAWRTTRMATSTQLDGEVHGYGDYWERTGGFTVRRELPHAEGVLIVNLADPIEITGGDGCAIRLRAGEAFVAGVHTHSALSHSTGTQAGIHVFLPLATVRRLLGVPMGELVDRVMPLDALLGRSARELGDALGDACDAHARADILDETLEVALASATPLDERLTHALAVLRERPDREIARIADDVGWSRKHLAARVRDAVGVGPPLVPQAAPLPDAHGPDQGSGGATELGGTGVGGRLLRSVAHDPRVRRVQRAYAGHVPSPRAPGGRRAGRDLRFVSSNPAARLHARQAAERRTK